MSLEILFILKQNAIDYLDQEVTIPKVRSSGLLNSATFVSDALREYGITTELEIAIDGNCIDKFVSWYRPKIVILEALWVTPDKVAELSKLHPKVQWIVRLHSEVPFLAMEGIAFEWVREYVKIPRVTIASNSPRCKEELETLLKTKLILLPNYYPMDGIFCTVPSHHQHRESLNVGCFGAIRPFKNQVLQAIAAIAYGDKVGKSVRFHINSSRVENGGQPVLKSIRAMFKDSGHTLVEHEWHSHEQFLGAISALDVLLQVSFTETFNIVSADAISKGIPVVTSEEIYWSNPMCQADPTSLKDIEAKMNTALSMPRLNVWLNRIGIIRSNKWAMDNWVKDIRALEHK